MRIEVNVGNVTTEFCVDRAYSNQFEAETRAPMTVEVPGAKYTWDFKSGVWDGKTTLLTKDIRGNDMVYSVGTGLAPRLFEILDKHTLLITDNRGLSSKTLNAIPSMLRPYQADGVAKAFSNVLPALGWWPRGVIQVATGGGKTNMAVAMFEINNIATMFLVHRKDLMAQAVERFAQFGHTSGEIGDNKFNIQPMLNVATMQTIHRILQSDEDHRYDRLIKVIANCEQVFFDECHLMASTLDKGNLFCSIASKFTSATCRWGLTATPFMRTKYDNLLLESVAGGLLYSVSNADLIALGFLTAPKVRRLNVPGKMQVTRPKFNKFQKNKSSGQYWRDVADKGIRFNVVRNKLVADELISGTGPTLCLVATIEQGKFIQNLMVNAGHPPTMMLTGSDTTVERRRVVEALEDGSLKAVICTTIFDEGVDITNLRKVILASGGKSQVKLLQRIGRGLRIAAGKHEVEIVDFKDSHHIMLERHAAERLKCYRDEGFEVL